MADLTPTVEHLPAQWHEACLWLVENTPSEQLICILAYGSALFGKTHTELSDIDTTVILRRPFAGDAYILARARELCPRFDLTHQYLSDFERLPPDHYQFGNHGAFYAVALSSATAVYGQNIFVELAKRVSPAAIRRSLRQQVRDHLFRIRQKQTEGPTGQAFITMARKYLIRVMQNILFLEHGVDCEVFKYKAWSEWLPLLQRSTLLSRATLALAQDVYSSATPTAQECDMLLRLLGEDISRCT